MELSRIRNFSIIAHIDHGKSTLADRLIEYCGGLSAKEMKEQVLDTLDIERERGITIKAQSASLLHKKDGIEYRLNLIDTPGHVDFSYEVSRALGACEGALLVVDAAQGVEAQTVACGFAASDQNLTLIPVLNKIDLPASEPEQTKRQIEEIIGIEAGDALCISAKTGLGVPELLDRLVERVPPPTGDITAPTQALIIDAWFDIYVGVICLVRIKAGRLAVGDRIQFMAKGGRFHIQELGRFTPKRQPLEELPCGSVGYMVAAIKDIGETAIGDTVTLMSRPAAEPLPGFQPVQPRVFSGIYPADAGAYEACREALKRLKLNDAALDIEPENSPALGLGFRCGFLGTLHFEIVRERLEREFGMEVMSTSPTVAVEILDSSGKVTLVGNASKMPDANRIAEIREPRVEAVIITPSEHVGVLMQLCVGRRGEQKGMQFLGKQVSMSWDLPLLEILHDFYDRLKSCSSGYASLDYHFSEFRAADLVRIDILVNGKIVDALSFICHRTNSQHRGRAVVERLRELIPRQMFEIALQATIGKHVIARNNIKSLRKNVLAKCYGGDVSRKRKLLEKQKEGKRKMKQIGRVGVPPEAFLAVLESSSGS